MEREVPTHLLPVVINYLLQQTRPRSTPDIVAGARRSSVTYVDNGLIRVALRRLNRQGDITRTADGYWSVIEKHRPRLISDAVSFAQAEERREATEKYRRNRRAYVLAAAMQVAAGGELPPHPDTQHALFR